MLLSTCGVCVCVFAELQRGGQVKGHVQVKAVLTERRSTGHAQVHTTTHIMHRCTPPHTSCTGACEPRSLGGCIVAHGCMH